MFKATKKRFYFLLAHYFAFWARFVLRRWQPRIIVITGSSGKTTLLHMVEAQLGEQAIYSHHANSALGIPFFILGLPTNVGSLSQWPKQLLQAPLRVFKPAPSQKLFVVEADSDRPHEARFLARFLRPEVTLWVSVFHTHSQNFDSLVSKGEFTDNETAIAYEFGYMAAATKKLVIANGDQPALVEQLKRRGLDTQSELVYQKAIKGQSFKAGQTNFTIGNSKLSLPGLHPREVGVSLQMVNVLLKYLDQPLDPNYKKLVLPPGRSSVLTGKQNTTLVDSTYNTGLGATQAILGLFKNYQADHKWLVLGDMIELGKLEADEHRKLAEAILKTPAEHIVLLGPRTREYVLPILQKAGRQVESFDTPKEVLEFLQAQLKGGETVLFKGGRFLEGVIEQLLANPVDANKLVRRGAEWIKRRQKWGLPK